LQRVRDRPARAAKRFAGARDREQVFVRAALSFADFAIRFLSCDDGAPRKNFSAADMEPARATRSLPSRRAGPCISKDNPCVFISHASERASASPSELRQPMRCGDSECDQRSDSGRCFGCCAWRERLIIAHAIPKQHEHTYYLCQTEHDDSDNERPHKKDSSSSFVHVHVVIAGQPGEHPRLG
jgi:hypothetical protein